MAGNSNDFNNGETEVFPQPEREEAIVDNASSTSQEAVGGDPTSGNDPAEPQVSNSNENGGPKPVKKRRLPKWLRLILIVLAALVGGFTILSILTMAFYHEWIPATCTEPEICEFCGRTQGEPLGHDYQDATCTEPATCKRCGETQGEPLGHSVSDSAWVVDKESTCTEKGSKHGTCSRCGEEVVGEVELAAHTEGEPQITKEATINSDGSVTSGEKTVYCTVCGAAIRTEEYTLSTEEAVAQYKTICESPSFDDVARNPDDWEDHKVTFRGKVIQSMEDNGTYTLRVNVTQGNYGLWSDTIMVYYVSQSGSSRILEDDVLTFYGTMKGMYSYKTVLGATVTVPLLYAAFVE